MSTTQNSATAGTSLLQADIEMFARLGVYLDQLREARIERVTDREAREKYGIRFDGAKDCAGILFPYYIPHVDWRVTARLRRDHPEVKDGKLENKYLSPYGDSRHLYFPPGAKEKLADPDTVIVLVESEKAALAITAWAARNGIKLVALAMGGCWGWRGQHVRSEIAPNGERIDVAGPLPDLNYCNGRTVYILLDTNVATNSEVQRAAIALVVEMSRALRNCTVLVCDLPAMDTVNGPDDFIAVCGDEAIKKVFADAFSPADRSIGRQEEEWSEPESLGAELPPVPAFDEELLPDALRPWCIDIAELMQVPLDFPAVAAVAALGAAVMRRAKIQPKALDWSWTEYPNLWGAIVADPGMMKSPVITAVTAPLRKVEFLWHTEYESEVAEARSNKKLIELKERAWEQQYVAAVKRGGGLPIQPDDSVPEPRQKRLLTSDGTFEKLHEIMRDNPAGIACWRDELAGFLAGLERPGREQERAFFLEGWSGHSGFIVDRIERGSIYVPHCCLSVFGGIQPNRVRSYIADVLRGGPTDDGLMQRFGLLVWPDFNGQWRYVDRLPDSAAQQTAVAVYEQLVGLDAENPLHMKYDPAAQELFIAWHLAHERKVRSSDTPPVMRGHLAKYRKLMPGLSLLFALADGHTNAIPLECAQRAAAWCEYLEPHACRVYASKLTPEMAAAQTLGRKLKAGWHGEKEGSFTLRDVYRPQWTGLTSKDEARAALFVLVEYNWVCRIPDDSDGAGRPSEIYKINPRIKEAK